MKKLTLKEQEELANQIKFLWQIIIHLKKYKAYFEKIAKEADEKADLAVSAAVLNPSGYEVIEKKYRRVAKRTHLLIKMMDTLKETDDEVHEAEKRKREFNKINNLMDF